MGAQRWLDLGLFQLQPSEVMKIALVLALARYFHSAYLEDAARPLHLITPSLLALMPALLVLEAARPRHRGDAARRRGRDVLPRRRAGGSSRW